MTLLIDSPFFLFAKGNGAELIWIIVVFGFYAVSALAKMWANRSKASDDEESETSQAIELAKKYVKQRQTQQQQQKSQMRRRAVRNNEFTSEWDRQQEIKRQRLGKTLQIQPEPAKMVPVPKKQPPRPPVARKIPTYREVSPSNRSMQAVQQRKVARKQPAPPRIHKTKATSRPKKAHTIPVAKMIETPRSLDILLRRPNQLRSAIVLKEILDKPLALREAF